MKKRYCIVAATLLAATFCGFAIAKICLHRNRPGQIGRGRPDVHVPAAVLDAVKLADSIGGLTRIPVGGYWAERRLADQEDEKDGFRSGLSYPGHRQPGSMNVTRPDKPLDMSGFGPRLRACEAKWRPILDKNREIGAQRTQAIQELRKAFVASQGDLTEKARRNLSSNIVERAHLSPREAEQVFH